MIENPNTIYYRANWDLLQRNPVDPRPINIVFLTSISDTGKCDRNGTYVETGYGIRYMEGAIERIVNETRMWGRLEKLVRVVGVITDDTEKDMQNSAYSALPEPGNAWIHRLGLTTPDGRRLSDITYNIPSSFRFLPNTDSAEDRRNRRRSKFLFESAVLEKTLELGGDVIISDHYMARIDYLWAELGLWGRVLNIHPAVTERDFPFRFLGKTPTADAINMARRYREISVMTGATLHIVDEKIDEGPILAYTGETPVFATDMPQWLRYRNYTQGKLPLFIAGLEHYARNIYPYLRELDLRNGLQERAVRNRLYNGEEVQSYEGVLLG